MLFKLVNFLLLNLSNIYINICMYVCVCVYTHVVYGVFDLVLPLLIVITCKLTSLILCKCIVSYECYQGMLLASRLFNFVNRQTLYEIPLCLILFFMFWLLFDFLNVMKFMLYVIFIGLTLMSSWKCFRFQLRYAYILFLYRS